MNPFKVFLISLFSLITHQAFCQIDSSKLILLLAVDKQVPPGAEKVGRIAVIDKGFKINCGYDRTMEQAEEKARKLGGNVIKMTDLKAPDAWSTCYRLRADVYKMPDVPGYWARQAFLFDSVASSQRLDTVSYAGLFIYTNGPVTKKKYEVRVRDTTTAELADFDRYRLKIKPGACTVSINKNPDMTVRFMVEPGKVYFVRFSENKYTYGGKPILQLVSPWVGFHEYGNVSRGYEFQMESEKQKKK